MSLPDWIKPHDGIALSDGHGKSLDLALLASEMAALEGLLQPLDPRLPLGVVGDNSLSWIVSDLALMHGNRVAVPIPPFFTPEQITHLVASAGIRHVLHDGKIVAAQQLFPFLNPRATALPPTLPPATQKITFTSGTTGAPKGICLSREQQLATARGLGEILGGLGITRHLNLLPLSVLLENIAGIYVPLHLGARCICPPLKEVGLVGSSQFDAGRCLGIIEKTQAESVILLPQMLESLVACAQQNDPRLRSLKFIAVGGGVSSLATLERASELGLPVFEGYGLSECAAVVSLNRPGANRLGSVGRALPGVELRLAADGEIEVRGRGYAGILGEAPPPPAAWIATGDLGALDRDGFLSITGRKKNILITAFGRNVSPEWPERLLMDSGLLAQAIVLGDGQARLNAVLVPRSPDIAASQLYLLVKQVNAGLPDYAQISGWQVSPNHFSVANGFATANGRLRREAIARHFSRHPSTH